MGAVSAEAVLAALGDLPGPVEVRGDNRLAAELQERLADRSAAERPAIVVETDGDPGSIRAALARVDDLGAVILAGPPPGPMALDLYRDLHVRGLTVIGLAPGERG